MNDPAPAPANALGGVNCSVRMSGRDRRKDEERNTESGDDLEARWTSFVASLARRRFRRKRDVRSEGMLYREEGEHRTNRLVKPRTYGMRKIVT